MNHEQDQHPCKRNCLFGGDLMKCIQCVSCKQPFHLECTNLTKLDYEKFGSNTYDFFCSEKCYTRLFPFFNITQKKFDDLNSLEEDASNLFPCRKCRKECVVDCIQCDECDEWFHYECVRLTEEEFTRLGSNKFRVFFVVGVYYFNFLFIL